MKLFLLGTILGDRVYVNNTDKNTLQDTEDCVGFYDKDWMSGCQIWAAIMIKIAIENPDGTLQVQCLCTVGLVEFWKLDKIQQIFILIPNMIQNQVSFLLVICVPLVLNEGDQTN